MQNSCMNFVVYCYIFQHIYMLRDVIIMLCINFEDFPNNPLAFGFNSLCEKTLFFSIFYFPKATGLEKMQG
jgi:hypothetical protein